MTLGNKPQLTWWEDLCQKVFPTFTSSQGWEGKIALEWTFVKNAHSPTPNLANSKPFFFFFFPPNNVSKDRVNSFLLRNTFKTNKSYSDCACCGSAVSMLDCSPKVLTVLCWFLLCAALQPSDRMADNVNQPEGTSQKLACTLSQNSWLT